MVLNRREMLAACAAAVPTLAGLPSRAEPPAEGKRQRLGVVAYSYNIRRFAEPLEFVEHCHQLGGGGVQVGLGPRDREYAARLRAKLEAYGMYFEGVVRLPKDRADADRFAAEVRTAKEAGATVLRTVASPGRRYEVFDSAAAFRKWAEEAAASLRLAEPVAAREDVRLAVENHKDWRAGEMADVLKRLDSRHVGVCLDTGNNLALLEEPQATAEALAPWAHSVHLKDMGVAEYADGFLLAEVPLGEGILDLPKIIALVRKARPEVRFNLEMITRDPLKVPCLTSKYWATLGEVSGRDLAATLALVRKRARSLPAISGLPRERQLAAEEDNVRKCLAYADEHLGL
jgi:sugar phosphate isomerase/epimerase